MDKQKAYIKIEPFVKEVPTKSDLNRIINSLSASLNKPRRFKLNNNQVFSFEIEFNNSSVRYVISVPDDIRLQSISALKTILPRANISLIEIKNINTENKSNETRSQSQYLIIKGLKQENADYHYEALEHLLSSLDLKANESLRYIVSIKPKHDSFLNFINIKSFKTIILTTARIPLIVIKAFLGKPKKRHREDEADEAEYMFQAKVEFRATGIDAGNLTLNHAIKSFLNEIPFNVTLASKDPGYTSLNIKHILRLYYYPEDLRSYHSNKITKHHLKVLGAKPNTNGIIIGESLNRKNEFITQSIEDRTRHMFIVGATGMGKTTMLESMITQDIKSSSSLCLIDPHGDLADKLLVQLPKNRISDIIYFNPDDLDYPIGINLFDINSSLNNNEQEREKALVVESLVSIFRKVFSDDEMGGHRIEYILRNAAITAFYMDDPNIFTIYRLLEDYKYRKEAIERLTDNDLINFWKTEFNRAGSYQRVKMASGVTTKIGRFLSSPAAKRSFGVAKSTIDFDEILNDKILICNLSKGLLGEDTSRMFGSIILAKLQLASLRRARIDSSKRTPFYLYVDEFQNFATESFLQMLSESRKYGLHLIMAEQTTSQLDNPKSIQTILANTASIVSFRTASSQDETLLLPIFEPYLDRGDLMSLDRFKFYAKFSGNTISEPFSGQTIVTKPTKTNTKIQIIKSSRELYAYKYKENNS